jgi:hypothetical protein
MDSKSSRLTSNSGMKNFTFIYSMIFDVMSTFSINNTFYLMISETIMIYFSRLKLTRNRIKKDLGFRIEMTLQLNDEIKI